VIYFFPNGQGEIDVTEDEVSSVKAALLNLAAAVISTRRTIRLIVSQPSLLLSQDDKSELNRNLEEGGERLNKAVEAIGRLVIKDSSKA
jgi:hypothetical protein